MLHDLRGALPRRDAVLDVAGNTVLSDLGLREFCLDRSLDLGVAAASAIIHRRRSGQQAEGAEKKNCDEPLHTVLVRWRGIIRT